MGAKVPWSESSWGIRSMGANHQGTKVPQEQKLFAPGNESAVERKVQIPF